MLQNKNYIKNIIWHNHLVTCTDREQHHGHKSILLWFTGLSGSGKSTIASEMEYILYHLGISTYLLDGDNLRHGLCRDLDFNVNDRKENIRRVAEVAKLMVDAGLIVLAAFISPYRSDRKMVRNLLGHERFLEIFMDTPLEICEARDPKGLYKKARAGKLKNFTGLNAVYEVPDAPDIYLNGQQLVTKLIDQLLDFLFHHNIIKV
ncbi:adenylyl-sulfate kinase [Pantoea sp. Aalb]|nr:adenylyl-sulfate kinase [Pantoea sp. Aalb]